MARLTPSGDLLLQGLGSVLRPIGNNLLVEGHTDSRPINSDAFPSNWELSTARATAVLRHLIENEGVPAVRLSAVGYADTRPRATGKDEASLAKNRRGEIVVEAPKASATVTPTPTPSVNPTPTPGGSASPKP